MPQEYIKHVKKRNRVNEILLLLINNLFKCIWPIIPNNIFLGRILRINVALTRMCNANCIFCVYQFLPKKHRISMPENIFIRVLDSINKYAIPSIMLSPNLGEPLLVVDITDKIKLMRNVGARCIELTTNGIMLKSIGIDKILEEGPDIINISTAGFDESMYQRIYRSSKYISMRDGIKELLLKNSLRNNKKVINVWFRSDMEIEELFKAKEMEYVMKYGNEVAIMSEVDSWNGKIQQEMLTGILKIQTEIPKLTLRPCTQLIEVAIHPNGDIHACSCRNMGQDPDLHLGNIESDDLFLAYKKLGKVFSLWEKGRIPLICHKCCMYNDPAIGVLGRVRQLLTS